MRQLHAITSVSPGHWCRTSSRRTRHTGTETRRLRFEPSRRSTPARAVFCGSVCLPGIRAWLDTRQWTAAKPCGSAYRPGAQSADGDHAPGRPETVASRRFSIGALEQLAARIVFHLRQIISTSQRSVAIDTLAERLGVRTSFGGCELVIHQFAATIGWLTGGARKIKNAFLS